MLDATQATNLLQSLGVSSSMASKAVERTAQNDAAKDPLAFLQELQATLKSLTAAAQQSQETPAAYAVSTKANQQSTVDAFQGTQKPLRNSPAESNEALVKAPFSNFEEFKNWEKGLGHTFAEDYKAPDYIHVMGLSLGGGDSEAFKRYVFFKNNPECAVDYEGIRSGKLSTLPTDKSTLIKSDLSKMPAETAAFYRENPDQLLLAEGFNMDPTLYKMSRDGEITIPSDVDASEWLTQNKWTPDGIVANNNRVTFAQADFLGINGDSAGNYRFAKYDSATGFIVDLDGQSYDPTTGEAMA